MRNIAKRDRNLPAAYNVISQLLAEQVEEKQALSTKGDLIAIGSVKLVSLTHKDYKAFPVIATAHGEEGHILRITKPRLEDHTWEEHTGDKLRLLDLERTEEGHWLEGAAPIEQITFAIDLDGKQTWLAVRQAAATTIMHPLFHTAPVPQSVPKSFSRRYPPSRVDPNIANKITVEDTDGRAHVDVAFNSWYTREFAVLDEAGYMKTWMIEGSRRGRKTIKPGISGYIYDDLAAHDAAPDEAAAGWGKLIWVGDMNTIIMCNLRQLAMFHVDRKEKKLVRQRSPRVIPKGTFGRILDMKRSPVWGDKFYVLTDKKLFLLETQLMAGACQIVMSCPHYRESHLADLKIELHGQDETCTAFLYSGNTQLVNVYTFTQDTEAVTPVTWMTDSFFLETDSEESPAKQLQLRGLCTLPAGKPPVRHNAIMGKSIFQGKQFTQLFTLASEMPVSSTLLVSISLTSGATSNKPARYEVITPPNKSQLVPEKLKTRRRDEIVDDLIPIIPDWMAEDVVRPPRKPNYWEFMRRNTGIILGEKERLVDARTWYELATLDRPYRCKSEDEGSCFGHSSPQSEKCDGMQREEDGKTVADLVQGVVGSVQERMQSEKQGLFTLKDLSGFDKFTDDVDDGAATLNDFIGTINEMEKGGNLTIQLRTAGVEKLLELQEGEAASNLANIYDTLIDLYITSLPANTPGQARIAKERMIRNIAGELALSSLMVHLKSRPTGETQSTQAATVVLDFQDLLSSQLNPSQSQPSNRHLRLGGDGHEPPSSQPSIDTGFTESRFLATQLSTQLSQLVPPAPTPAPSTRAPSVAGSQATQLRDEAVEDPATSLLRSYALHIKSQKPLQGTRAKILGQWELGADPRAYVYREVDSLEVGEEAEDAAGKEEKEERERKRRRKEERALKRQTRMSRMSLFPLPDAEESQSQGGGRQSLGAFGSFSQPLGRQSFGGFGFQNPTVQASQPGSQIPRVQASQLGYQIPIVQASQPDTPRANIGGFGFKKEKKFGRKSLDPGIGGSRLSQNFGTPVEKPKKRKSLGPGVSAGGSQGTPIVGWGGVGSFGGVRDGGSVSQANAPQSSQVAMTHPMSGVFGGRQSLGGAVKKKRKGGF